MLNIWLVVLPIKLNHKLVPTAPKIQLKIIRWDPILVIIKKSPPTIHASAEVSPIAPGILPEKTLHNVQNILALLAEDDILK